MDEKILNKITQALDKANEELSKAHYLEECGSNPGIRKMNANKAEWLSWVISLAEDGFESLTRKSAEEREAGVSTCEDSRINTEASKLAEEKDKLIKDLQDRNEDLVARLNSLQLSYDCEVEYRKALAQRAKVDHVIEVLKLVHDRCWLDGTVLVTPVEYLDRALLELIKE